MHNKPHGQPLSRFVKLNTLCRSCPPCDEAPPTHGPVTITSSASTTDDTGVVGLVYRRSCDSWFSSPSCFFLLGFMRSSAWM